MRLFFLATNKIFRQRFHAVFFCLLIVTTTSKAMAAPVSAEGWKRLWLNQNAAARAAFRAALKQNPADGDALRGLGLLASQEDDNAGALSAWSEMIHQTPERWTTAAYWPEFTLLAEQTGRYALLEQAARDILKSKRTSSAMRASARLALADTADRAGAPALAEKQWAAPGYIRKWNVIGPFDNVSRSGFAKAFPPETEIDFKAGSHRAQ